MIKGSCYCGTVRYEIAGRLLIFANCHCPDCRKFSGSAFSSVLAVDADGFKVTSGEGNLVPYPSSPGKYRHFCKTCGCHVFARAEQRPGMVLVRAGTLDEDPHMQPQCHLWVKAKAPWHQICDSITQHQEGYPKR
ncbi:MAG: GFA family protein [Phycisphaerae bacterium]|nr:GFA family protein [Phycisphaerae bacterium]